MEALINKHDGLVKWKSVPGQGLSRFNLYYPGTFLDLQKPDILVQGWQVPGL